MFRVLLGILKGGLVGGALGFGAWKAGLGGGGAAWALYGAVGFLVGIVCGRAIWRQETLWTPLLKGVVGFVLCAGLFWVARRFLGGVTLAPLGAALGRPEAPVVSLPVVVGPALGVLYGIFVEIDDGGSAAKEDKK